MGEERMKMIIAGGRDFKDYEVMSNVLRLFQKQIDEVVSGDAAGADTLGARWGEEHNIPVKHFPADWDHYGTQAGYIRNAQMADYADGVICFWDGKSKGTKHMIKTAHFNHLMYWVYDYKGNGIVKGNVK